MKTSSANLQNLMEEISEEKINVVAGSVQTLRAAWGEDECKHHDDDDDECEENEDKFRGKSECQEDNGNGLHLGI